MFVVPSDVSNDGSEGSSVAVGLSNPIDEDGAIEGLAASDDPRILLLCSRSRPLAVPTTSLGYLVLLIYCWCLHFGLIIFERAHLFFPSRLSLKVMLTQKVFYIHNGTY